VYVVLAILLRISGIFVIVEVLFALSMIVPSIAVAPRHQRPEPVRRRPRTLRLTRGSGRPVTGDHDHNVRIVVGPDNF